MITYLRAPRRCLRSWLLSDFPCVSRFFLRAGSCCLSICSCEHISDSHPRGHPTIHLSKSSTFKLRKQLSSSSSRFHFLSGERNTIVVFFAVNRLSREFFSSSQDTILQRSTLSGAFLSAHPGRRLHSSFYCISIAKFRR